MRTKVSKIRIAAGLGAAVAAISWGAVATPASAATLVYSGVTYGNSTDCNNAGRWNNGRFFHMPGYEGTGSGFALIYGWSCRGNGGRQLWFWV